MSKPLLIAGRSFDSRLFLGTGKFPSPESMRGALEASGTQIVTVALRRVDLSGQKDPFANILEFPKRYPGAQVYKIETNYRSTPEILSLANAAIAADCILNPAVVREMISDPNHLHFVCDLVVQCASRKFGHAWFGGRDLDRRFKVRDLR